jgi:hypothetical protein
MRSPVPTLRGHEFRIGLANMARSAPLDPAP